MGYRLDSLGLIPSTARFSSSSQHPDKLGRSLTLLSSRYWELFAWD
jgi:hypothetical protein